MNSLPDTSYSKKVGRILDIKERLKIASQIRQCLKKIVSNRNDLICLDIGCSSGIITYELSKDFKEVIGIDIDQAAIALAQKKFQKKNLKYQVMSGEDLTFKSNRIDVIVCNQVYQFVADPNKMMAEIERVLKVNGVCFMSARNKYAFYEGQTNLPLIHLLPKFLTTKKYFQANYLNYFELNYLFRKFEILNLTAEILKSPKEYGFLSLAKYQFFIRLLPKFIINLFMPILPNYIFILKK